MGIDPGSIAVKAGLMALQMGLSMLNKTEGPRLDSLDVTTADYGTPIVRFVGNRRLEGVPIIWAEKLREKKTTSKTKGGKYSEYKYFGTFAVLITDEQIQNVSRIWMDKHLVYDMTKPGPIAVLGGFFSGLGNSPVKLARGRNMRIYLGTEDQMPDPAMEAWCEDRYGPDSCPAYRGVSYIVFDDIPLEKFGNRIPQITVEAMSAPQVSYLHEVIPAQGASGLLMSEDGSSFYAKGAIWDSATRTKYADMYEGPDAITGDGMVYNVISGSILRVWSSYGSAGPNDIAITTPDGLAPFVSECEVIDDTVYFKTNGYLFSRVTFGSGPPYTVTTLDFAPTNFAKDSDGNVWMVGRPYGVLEIHIQCLKGPRQGESAHFTSTAYDAVKIYIGSDDTISLQQGGTFYRLNPDLTVAATAALPSTAVYSQSADILFASTTGYLYEYSLTDLSLVRSIPVANWGVAGAGYYCAQLHALIIAGGVLDHQIDILYLDRTTDAGVTLGSVISKISSWVGLTPDVADLDQIVTGYSVTQGPAKDMIQPLLDIHDVDVRPHNFDVQFIKRGKASLGTILTSSFVREDEEPRYKVTIKQDTDLPRRLTLNFADADKDQQTNTVISQRPLDAMDGDRESQIDLTTYVATPAEAQKYADRYFRRQWNEREGIENALTAQYLALEPGDTLNLSLDGVERYARIKKMTIRGIRVDVEWVRDALSLNSLSSGEGAAMEGRDEEVIYVPSPTKGLVKDIPLITDSHESVAPQLYYGAGPFTNINWPGATIFEGDNDGDDYAPWKSIDSADKASWGFATNALGNADPWMWDRGRTVNIRTSATLTSCTESDINADPTRNLVLLGKELLNFTTATLEADGTYTLSGLKRGRRGTEWACPTHVAGDEFVIVDTLDRDSVGASDVGLTFHYKAQTIGRDISNAPEISFTFTAASLKPYAPARIKWAFDGTDMQGTIIRRTRIGGAWVGGTTIPLSEASEAYEVEIYNGSTLKRTISVSGNSFTYTAAMAAADGLTVSNIPTFKAYQLSDAVGRGFALAA